jgi:hypothetical protein
MASQAKRRNPLPKSDTVLMRQVRRYIRRYGGSAEAAAERLRIGRFSGPKPPEQRLAAAMQLEGMGPVTVKKAREGYWSDFKSPLEFPKVELVNLLMQSGRRGLAKRVEDGEFDD